MLNCIAALVWIVAYIRVGRVLRQYIPRRTK
jgi:hypothetical protein